MSNSSLSALYQEFSARGWTKKCTGRIFGELAFHFVLMITSIAVFIAVDNLLVRLVALYFVALGSFGMATNAHSGSHFAASPRNKINWLLTFIGYPLNVMISGTFWRHKHVVVHHPTPNVAGLDDDIDLLPFFALNQKDYTDAGRLRRTWYRYQWILVPLVIALNGFNLAYASWKFLIGRLLDREQRTVLHWIDLGAMTLHLVLWVGLPMLFFTPAQAVGFWAIRGVMMGYTIFFVFAPAHFPGEALFLDPENKDRREYLRNRDWCLLQCATTTNLKTTPFGNLFCSGTDYQIEHHLFPGIPHPYLPKMAPYVKAWCAEHGYPYRTLGFVEGFWKSWMAFRNLKPLAVGAEGARLAVAGADGEMITERELAQYQLL